MPNCVICIGNKATHGTKRTGKQYCKDCAAGIEGIGRLTGKLCRFEDCISEPNYNFIGDGKGIYCSIHKLEGMEDVKHKKCEYIDANQIKCKSIPTYGIDGGKPIYCKPHSELFENMILIRKDLCKFKDENGNSCGSRASFNTEGNKMGKWCKKHKGPDDVFVLKVIYCKENCGTRASYNYKKYKNPLYCLAHRKIGMINIVDDRCEIEDCIKMATHAGDDGILMYCAEHKKEGMKNIRSKKCAFKGCEKEPTYNVKDKKIRLYCGEHADKETMINIKCPRCIKCKDKEAFCNFKGEKKRLYCLKCRNNDMVNLSKKTCKNELFECLTEIYGDKYEGYCARCYTYLFPDNPKAKNYKTKEVSVQEFIRKEFPDLKILCDKIIPNGSSKKRPDICIYKDYYNIIIEIDENQHNDYEKICENKRTMELFTDLGNKPLVMIRFNPDEYWDNKKNIIKSCWNIDKKGMAIINRNKKNEWISRLEKLKNTLEYYLNNKPHKEIQTEYLYYDIMN